jgi:hypothetical protein
MSRPRSIFAFALAALLACVFATAGAYAAVPGINVGGNFFFSKRTYHAVAQSGAGYARFFMFWQTIEPKRGRFDEFTLKAYEHALASLPAGTRALFVVVGTPPWAGGRFNSHASPRHPAEYASFLHYLAGRFAGKVAAWEIWNEPDAPIWFTGNAAQYTALLKVAYPAVKSADPNATVVTGGLTGNNFHFLQQLYADGAKGSFDVVSDHTDTACNLNPPGRFTRDRDGRINQFSFLGYREVHKVMLANGDNKPIWLTEMGWDTSRRLCDAGRYRGQKAGGISEASQASYLTRAYHCLALDPYVQVSFWFQLQDYAAQDSSQNRYGLLRSNFTHKPAFKAFSNYAHSGDHLHGACR